MLMVIRFFLISFCLFLISCNCKYDKEKHFYESGIGAYPLVYTKIASGLDTIDVCVDIDYLFKCIDVKIMSYECFCAFLYELDKEGKPLMVSKDSYNRLKPYKIKKCEKIFYDFCRQTPINFAKSIDSIGLKSFEYDQIVYIGFLLWKYDILVVNYTEDGDEWIIHY